MVTISRPFIIEKFSGVEVSNLDFDTLLKCVHQDMNEGRTSVIVAVNPEKIRMAGSIDGFTDILNSFEYPIPDGIGIVRASKRRGGAIGSTLTGIDTMERLAAFAAKENVPVFFYGAAPGVAEKMAERLSEKYGKLTVAGIVNGYVENRQEVISAIERSGAKIVFVALGSPKQEYFMNECRACVNGCVFQGVGGSFDVLSGQKKRAPLWMRKLGLEWFYRLIKEPSRIYRQLQIVKFIFSKK